jgi:hypothetical protein
MAGSCEHGDEPSGSDTTELVSLSTMLIIRPSTVVYQNIIVFVF